MQRKLPSPKSAALETRAAVADVGLARVQEQDCMRSSAFGDYHYAASPLQKRAAQPDQGRYPLLQRQARSVNRNGLPGQLKTGIESLSGMNMDSVKVHYNSAKPAQLSALAYAQGREIHLAPGQERHLPHEAWHLVQQAQGRVKPTAQIQGGVAVNDDAGLEREATQMGDKAMAAPPGPCEPSEAANFAPANAPVQRVRIQLPNKEWIETRHHSRRELFDLMTMLRLEGEYGLATQIKFAVRKGQYDRSSGRLLYQDFKRRVREKDDYPEEDDSDLDLSQYLLESSNARLLQPGLNYAFKQKRGRKKNARPMPIRKLKGEMLEMAFDTMRMESGQPNISSNSFVFNCPGIDHISPFGDKLFEQSKCFTSGSTDQMLKSYDEVMEKRHEDGSLLLNKGGKKGKTGGDIRDMFSFAQSSVPQEGHISSLKKMSEEMQQFVDDDEQPDFDETHERVEDFSSKYYMQLPMDLWEKKFLQKNDLDEEDLHMPEVKTRSKPGDDFEELDSDHEDQIEDMDEFFAQELTTSQILKFEKALETQGLGTNKVTKTGSDEADEDFEL